MSGIINHSPTECKCMTIYKLLQVGPGFYEKWFYWQSCSNEQKVKAAIRSELERILMSEVDHKALLTFEEITTV